MYEARQETRRKEVECCASDALVDALARCIDDTHVRASRFAALRSELDHADDGEGLVAAAPPDIGSRPYARTSLAGGVWVGG
jgi:hypothetical protein